MYKRQLEKLIDILKTMEGKEEEVKKLEADITALNKKKPANSVARDHMDLSRICNRSEGEVEKKITAAKANLQKRWMQGTSWSKTSRAC